jgi:hypothetical protein
MLRIMSVKATLLLLFCYSPLIGQSLESIGKEKPLVIAGGVSLSQIVYTASGVNDRRDAYIYYASGNVNFPLYGWSVSLSFSFSNQNTTFQRHFNQYSLHPTYKWITAHAGYTSMSYSPYTVNGHVFLGGAVDLAIGSISYVPDSQGILPEENLVVSIGARDAV